MSTDSNEITRLEATFEGRGLMFYLYQGRVCVVAAALGRALGYAGEGRKLGDRISGEWAGEFLAGTDFQVLTGAALRAFKALLGDTPDPGVSSTARLMILYESGVSLVCVKTNKPEGMALRRYLVDDVLPKLRRGELVPVRRKRAPRLSPVRAALKRLVDEALLAGRPDVAYRILGAALELEPRLLEAPAVVQALQEPRAPVEAQPAGQ
jgi:prophage antirepressor-like protein